MKVDDFKPMKLAGHFSAHAQVKELDLPMYNSKISRIHVYVLRSYDTEVAEVVTGHDCYIKINGLYSTTTRRHIRWFLEEFYPGRHIPMDAIKVAAGNDNSYITEYDENLLVISAETGEVLWAKNSIEDVDNKTAVKMAENHMKNNYTWNNYDFSYYRGREM